MFDKLKGALNHRVEVARDMRAHPGPADLAALPPDCAAAGGLGAVPIEAISSYVGIEVREVRPLGALGPESSGLIGYMLRSRLRDASVGDPNLEPVELMPGQNEARMERMRGVLRVCALGVWAWCDLRSRFVCQLGPDGAPVIRAQLLAGNCAIGGNLNGRAVLDGHHVPRLPVADNLRRNAKCRHDLCPDSGRFLVSLLCVIFGNYSAFYCI